MIDTNIVDVFKDVSVLRLSVKGDKSASVCNNMFVENVKKFGITGRMSQVHFKQL